MTNAGGFDWRGVGEFGGSRTKWTMPIKNWKAALQQFAILYEDRLQLEALATTGT